MKRITIHPDFYETGPDGFWCRDGRYFTVEGEILRPHDDWAELVEWKRRSRAEDERRLQSGEVTRAELVEENCHFRYPIEVVR